MEKPLVSVYMITYNQEKYIAMAIESVINQKVNFQYELLIGEDASTDGTADIVDKYKRLYPDRIKVFHREKNLGIRKNGHLLMNECKGKYVAVLEGDDYWCFDRKLQMQVDYLEENEDIIATAHNVYSIDINGKELNDQFVDYPFMKQHIYYRRNAIECEDFGQMSSLVYRNLKYVLNKYQWKEFINCKLNADYKTGITLGMLGKCVFFEGKWSCRRRMFEGDGWSASTYQKNPMFFVFRNYIKTEIFIKSAFGVDINVTKYLRAFFRKSNKLAVEKPSKENFQVALMIDVSYIKYLIQRKFGFKITIDQMHFR